MKLSAIVSVFNSAQFIHGCLENLVQQTIYIKGEMEILIIDSGSQENENLIIFEFQKKYRNIKYLKTTKRETLYKAWNRGIRMSQGNFITNSNTDDRHESTCLETLVNNLEKNHEIDLVYGNLFKSTIKNETFNENDLSIPCSSQSFFPSSLLLHNYIGAQPVWRKAMHNNIGLFDENYRVLGDYEFILRSIKKGSNFKHIPNAKGLMLWHKNALSTCDQSGIVEKRKLFSYFRKPKIIEIIYQHASDSSEYKIEIESFLDIGIRCLCYFPQFFNGLPQFDFEFAKRCFEQNQKNKVFEYNLSSLREIIESENILNPDPSKNKLIYFYGSTEEFAPEYELKGTLPIYLHKCKNEKIGGQFRQKFSFNLQKFHAFLFGHIPLDSISTERQILIWGFNERGKLFGNYLNSRGFKKVQYIDSSIKTSCSQFDHYPQKVFSLNDVRKEEDAVFILAMSSHHWESTIQQIIQYSPNPLIFKIDHT
jgi:glycosyltransferase involved in cell wall biosynthesis